MQYTSLCPAEDCPRGDLSDHRCLINREHRNARITNSAPSVEQRLRAEYRYPLGLDCDLNASLLHSIPLHIAEQFALARINEETLSEEGAGKL